MPATLEKDSPCKVNLLLNILGKRSDGFHELETVMQPIQFCDRLVFTRAGSEIQLSCSEATLPVNSENLVYRAAASFLQVTEITDGVRIHLEKKIPMAAGLGGGSGNAAVTLLGLNELFGNPLSPKTLHTLAASLGSDVPFFLQARPALATGRGEKIESFEPFSALKGASFLLIHPGFGISTAWAYQTLAKFPKALNGIAGRAQELVTSLQQDDLKTATGKFYNSLEAPALDKYPILKLYQEFLLENGAVAALMSGSGSTTFVVIDKPGLAEQLVEKFKGKFGQCWTAVVPAQGA